MWSLFAMVRVTGPSSHGEPSEGLRWYGPPTGHPFEVFDIVYVPRSHIANVNIWVDQYIREEPPDQPCIFL